MQSSFLSANEIVLYKLSFTSIRGQIRPQTEEVRLKNKMKVENLYECEESLIKMV
jgi:hypothetical protein